MARRPWKRRKPPKGRFPWSGPTSDPPFRRTDLPRAVGPSGGFQPAGLLHTTLVDQPHGFCRGAFLSSICFALHSCPTSARSCSQFVIHCISSAAGEAPPPRLQPRRGPPAAGKQFLKYVFAVCRVSLFIPKSVATSTSFSLNLFGLFERYCIA